MQDKVNLPITGIASFAKYPIHTDLTTLDADIAVIGVPYDLGMAYMNGSNMAAEMPDSMILTMMSSCSQRRFA